MNGNIAAAIITSATTIATVVYTNRRQLDGQTRKIKAMTTQQTEQIKAHVEAQGAGERP